MKLKVEVLDADGKTSLSLWGSKSGTAGGLVKTGDSFEIEGGNVSVSGADPIPQATDAGLGG